MSECSEIAANIPVNRRLTWQDAEALVRNRVGHPAEVGHQIFDNVVKDLVQRSKRIPIF